MLKNCKTYWEAVDSLCDNFASVDAASGNNTLKVLTDEKTYLMIVNTKNGRTSTARCNKQDKFDYRIGLAIAWARYNNISVSINAKLHLSELPVGSSFVIEKVNANYTFIVDSFVDDGRFVFCRDLCNRNRDDVGFYSSYKKFSCNLIVNSVVTIT